MADRRQWDRGRAGGKPRPARHEPGAGGPQRRGAAGHRPIARGIERREDRVLVGDDARRAAFIQRLFPVGYWKYVARRMQKQLGRAG